MVPLLIGFLIPSISTYKYTALQKNYVCKEYWLYSSFSFIPLYFFSWGDPWYVHTYVYLYVHAYFYMHVLHVIVYAYVCACVWEQGCVCVLKIMTLYLCICL